MQKKRSVGAFKIWAEYILQQILKDSTLMKAIRNKNSRICDYFFDEVLPLKRFLSSSSMYQDAFVQMPFDDRHRDAIITKINGKEQFIEITSAKDGHQVDLRNNFLKDNVCVPLFGAMKSKGSKASGKQTITPPESIARSLESIVNKRLKLIESSINKKVDKTYPLDTILIVYFHENFLPSKQLDDEVKQFKKDVKQLEDGIREILKNTQNHNFSNIFILNTKGKIYS